MSDTELNPCPFCKGTAIAVCTRWIVKPYSLIECKTCGASIARVSKAEAVEVWNRRESGWIPVSERLPEKAGIYLIAFGDSVRESLYDVMRNKWDSGLSCEPFAWMPLPEPFEMGK